MDAKIYVMPRGTSTSVTDLKRKIRAFITDWNNRHGPFRWSPEEILGKAKQKNNFIHGPLAISDWCEVFIESHRIVSGRGITKNKNLVEVESEDHAEGEANDTTRNNVGRE